MIGTTILNYNKTRQFPPRVAGCRMAALAERLLQPRPGGAPLHPSTTAAPLRYVDGAAGGPKDAAATYRALAAGLARPAVCPPPPAPP